MTRTPEERAREYEATAAALYRQIGDLDRDDPESKAAGREWSMQAAHAERMAAEIRRWAMKATK